MSVGEPDFPTPEHIQKAGIFAIQNGHSTKNQLKNTTKQYHQHFFCFGEYDKSRYEKFDHTVFYFSHK